MGLRLPRLALSEDGACLDNPAVDGLKKAAEASYIREEYSV